MKHFKYWAPIVLVAMVVAAVVVWADNNTQLRSVTGPKLKAVA